MSKEIDERIVELRFDNKDFEKNAEQSMNTLKRLQDSLDLDGGSALQGFSASVTKVTENFSILEEAAKGALWNIGQRAEQAGEQLVKSLSIDQVTAGFQKYEEKTKSVQTIMNATGDSIDVVNGYLEQLMWFTDETSYNFVDMTSNIGKFTAQRVPLKKAVTAMQGIATWAAKSGQGANEASRAMYNLSQALGVGAVKLMDWKSIENANMATAEFKQLAIETAKELGTLTEAAETAKGEVVDVANFSSTLSEGWFSSDVLLKVLEDYGDYADQLHELVEETGLTASEAMKILDQTYEGIGMSAFKAAQEAKTFTDAIDATKDAVSTGWLQTFELIFGNYEEAKVLWTDLANGLYDVFASGAEGRNELLKEWKDLGGRDELIEGLTQACRNLVGILDLLKDAWQLAFPPITANRLYDITVRFREMMQNLQLTETAYNNLRDAIGGVLTIFRVALHVVGAVIEGLFGMAGTLNQIAGAIVAVAGEFGRYLMAVGNAIDTTENMAYITKTVAGVVQLFKAALADFAGIAAWAFDLVSEALSKLGFNSMYGLTGVEAFTNVLKEGFRSVVGDEGFLSDMFIGFADAIGKAVEAGASFVGFLQNLLKAIQGGAGYKEFFFSMGRWLKSFQDTELGNSFDNLAKGIATVTNEFADFFQGFSGMNGKIQKVLQSLKMGFADAMDYIIMRFKELSVMDMVDASMILAFAGLMNGISNALGNLAKVVTGLTGPFNNVLKEVQNTLKVFQTQIKAKVFVELATAIALLAASLLLISIIPIDKLMVASGILLIFAAALTKVAGAMDQMGKKKKRAEGMVKVAGALTSVALAVGILSVSMALIAQLDYGKIAAGTLAIIALMAALGAFAVAMKKFKGMIDPKAVAGVTTLAIGILALVAPLKLLATFEVGDLVKSITALGFILGELAVFAAIARKNTSMLSQGAGITIMALGILELVGVLKLLSMMEVEELKQGLISLGVLLAELAATIAIMGAFSSAPGVAMAALLPVLALGIAELAGVVYLLGQLPFDAVKVGLIALGGALAILVAGSAGLTMFLPGLMGLGTTLFQINTSVAALVASFALLAAALPLAAAGIASFALLSGDVINKAFDNIEIVFHRLLEFIIEAKAQIRIAAVTMFGALLEALVDLTPHILNGIRVLVDELLNFLIEYGPVFFDKLTQILRIIDDFMAEWTEILVDYLLKLIIGAINGIANNLEGIIDAIQHLWDSIMDVIWKYVSKWGSDIMKAGKDLWNNFITGFTDNSGNPAEKTVKTATKKVGKAAVEGLREGIDAHSPSEATAEAGEDFNEGFLGSISSGLNKVSDWCKNLGDTAVEGFNSGLFGKKTGVEEFLGGITESISAGTPAVSTAASNVSSEAGDAAIQTASNKKIGKTVTSNVATEIEEDTSLEDAAKEKAEQVADIFSTEFSKIDIALSKIGHEFDIWKAIQGPDADEGVLKRGELAQAEKELKEYAKQYQIAFDNYQYLVDNPDLVQSPTELVEKQETYMKYLAEMYKKAADIADMQKEMSDQYKEANELAEERMRELQQEQMNLVSSIDFRFSDETEEAYSNFMNAVSEDAKQQYFDIWKELKSVDLKNAGIAPIDPSEVKREVYKEMGLDPNNAMEGWIDVESTVANLISETSTSYLRGLELAYPTVVQSYGDIIAQGTENVLEDVKYHYPEFELMGERMVESTETGINKSSPKVARAGIEVNTNAIEEVSRVTPQWEEVGEEMMEGIRKGIAEGRSKVIDEAVEVALAALQAAKNALGIASPSKKFKELGYYAVEGFAIGLANTKERAENASNEVMRAATRPAERFGTYIQDLMDDIDPVMTPILDLSQAEASLAYLNSMMDDTSGRMVGGIASSELARQAEKVTSGKVEPKQVVYNENFTQNNYSPKALSAIEIYRQTNNQLMRGRRSRT